MTHVANRVNTGEKANHTKNGEEQTAQTINMKPQSRSEYFSCISGSLTTQSARISSSVILSYVIRSPCESQKVSVSGRQNRAAKKQRREQE